MIMRRVLQLFLLIFTTHRAVLADCPHLCECKWKSGKESVICLNANLSVVPLHLDAGTQVLDLTANNIVSIKHDEFSKAGLVNLQKIFISKCRLKSLDRYSFRNIINLVELDMSYNALSAIPSHIFDSISELRELKLNGNPIQRVTNDAFVYLPQLVRLELSECRIGTIENRAFHGLDRTLRFLNLDKNKLMAVSSSSITILDNLNGIELAGNPWNCTCDLRPLREWMLKKNVPFGIPPLCQHPKRLQGKLWDRMELDEFACIPEIFAFESKAFGVEGRNVTMTCRIHGIPEPNVRWLLKNKVIANLSGTPYSNGKKLYIVHLQNNASDLTILTADVQDAGVYICTAENKAGRAEASVTLAVSKKPTENTLSTRVFMASIIAGTLFVLAACLVTLCIFTYKKKRSFNTRWRRGDCRAEDPYEKIEMNHHINKMSAVNGRSSDVVAAVVGGTRKNGDYSVVSGVDTDQDGEDEEEEGRCKETKIWKPGPQQQEERSVVVGADWNATTVEDMSDLHIPRRIIAESIREESTSPTTLPLTQPVTKHTSKSPTSLYTMQHPLASLSATNPTIPSTSSTSSRILPQVPPRSKKLPPPHLGNPNSLSCSVPQQQQLLLQVQSQQQQQQQQQQQYVMGDHDKKVFPPDLIENSSPSKYNNNFHTTGSRACSEGGGSVTDINELFCTLPRKRPIHSRYRSSDSQSPLLPESRYGSSGCDSTTSNSSASAARRLSDCQKYSTLTSSNCNNKNKNNPKSTSYLNLTVNNHRQSSSPIRELELLNNATPLLDIASLENRITYKQADTTPQTSVATTTTNLNSYDYHAAQLERFLEEYRTLQKELTRMKETCDNMRQDKLQNSLPVTPSSSSLKSPMQIGGGGGGGGGGGVMLSNTSQSPNSNQTLAASLGGYDGAAALYLDGKNNRLLNNQ